MNVKQAFLKQFAGFFLCGTWNKNIDFLYEESLNYALVLGYQGSVIKQRFLDPQQFHPGRVSVKLTDSRCISQPTPQQRADSKVSKTQALSSDSLTDRHEIWKSSAQAFSPDAAPPGAPPVLTPSEVPGELLAPPRRPKANTGWAWPEPSCARWMPWKAAEFALIFSDYLVPHLTEVVETSKYEVSHILEVLFASAFLYINRLKKKSNF